MLTQEFVQYYLAAAVLFNVFMVPSIFIGQHMKYKLSSDLRHLFHGLWCGSAEVQGNQVAESGLYVDVRKTLTQWPLQTLGVDAYAVASGKWRCPTF